jgi:3-hydroxyisobutyrate dehydrogenase-like beta-hydroxyacid dehydrogenase
MKLVNNVLSAARLTATAEAVVDSGFATALMDEDLRGFLKLAGEVGYTPRVTARWFRQAMAGPLAAGDHVEVGTLIGYPEGGRA